MYISLGRSPGHTLLGDGLGDPCIGLRQGLDPARHRCACRDSPVTLFLREQLPRLFPLLTTPGHGMHRTGIGVCACRGRYHPTGRAADIFLNARDPRERAIGDALFRLFIDQGPQLGVCHVIWNRQIWSESGGGPRPYTGESPHTNHVHVFFAEQGAAVRPTWFLPYLERLAFAGAVRSGAAASVQAGGARQPAQTPSSLPASTRTPPATAQGVDPAISALIGEVTRRLVPAAEWPAFQVIETANERTESGGRSVWSSLRTTALFPASFGRGQLVVQVHLDKIGSLTDAERTLLGLATPDLQTMRRLGEAAIAWYQVVVDRRSTGLATARLTAREAQDLRGLVEARRWSDLVARFGARFAEGTGLPGTELAFMAMTRLLLDSRFKNEWLAEFRRLHGRAFHPRHRRGEEMEATSVALIRTQPALQHLYQRLGGVSLGYYLGRGRPNENRAAWYARAAANYLGSEALEALLRRIDPLTTRLRHIENFNHALRAVREAQLTGGQRTVLLGRIARQFHASPAAARRRFFTNNVPKFRTATELEGALRSFSSDLQESDQRWLAEYRSVTGARV